MFGESMFLEACPRLGFDDVVPHDCGSTKRPYRDVQDR